MLIVYERKKKENTEERSGYLRGWSQTPTKTILLLKCVRPILTKPRVLK